MKTENPPQLLFSALSNYLAFLRSPTYLRRSQPVRWREIAALFVLYLMVSFLLGTLIYGITERLRLNHKLENVGTTEIWLAILLVPPVEELLFRLWLRVTRRTLLVLVGLVCFTALLLTSYVSYLFIAGLLSVGIAALTVVVLRAEDRVERVAIRHFNILFYFSVFLFGLVHIFNYTPLTWHTWLVAPVLVLPQCIVGSMLGFIRVRYGIFFSILFHTMVNAFLFAIFYLGQ